MFLANYADGLSDLPLDRQIAEFRERDAVASLAAVRSGQSFHAVHAGADGVVTHMGAMPEPAALDQRRLLRHAAQTSSTTSARARSWSSSRSRRLIAERKLATFRWDGFWQCMDTFKDKISFDRMEARGDCPWMIWKRASGKRAPD